MIKKILCSVFVAAFVFLPLAGIHAQGTIADLQPQVYVKNLNIVKDNVDPGESIKGSFALYSIDTRAAVNYSYVVSLIQDTPSGKIEIGSLPKQTFDLGPKGAQSLDFSYPVPNVKGSFLLRVSTYGPTGYEINHVQKSITINGNGKVLVTTSENVIVGKEKFDLQNGPTATGSTSAYVSFSLKNTTGEAVNLNPQVSIFVKSVKVGEKVLEYSAPEISLKIGEEKTVKIEIQVPEKPEVYEGSVVLENQQNITIPEIPFRIIRGGKIATIQSVTSDQVKIEKGSSLPVNISYTGTPEDISSDINETNFPVVISVKVTDKEGALLGQANSSIMLSNSGEESIEVPIEKNNKGDVSAEVTIKSEDGVVLATGSYLLISSKFDSSNDDSQNSVSAFVDFINKNWKFGLAIVLVILFAGVLVGVFVKTRNATVFTVLALLISGSLIGGTFYATHFVKAQSSEKTVYLEGVGCSYKDLTVNSWKEYSHSLETTDKGQKTIDSIIKNKTCQYVTEKSVGGQQVIGSINSCNSIVLDSVAKTCTATVGSKDSKKVISNCIAVNKQVDTISGTSYKAFVLKTENKYSKSLEDKYLLPCGLNQISTLDVCQYVTEKTVAEGKNPYALGSIGKCSSVSVDQSSKTCNILTSDGKTKTITDCVAGNKQSDSVVFDTSSNCEIDYTDNKGVQKEPLKIKDCRPVGKVGDICTYYSGKALKTQKNCTGISDYTNEYSLENGRSCDVHYLDKKGKLRSFTKSNCKNVSYDESTGICTYDLLEKKAWTTKTQSDCRGIIDYSGGSIDVAFTTLAPKSDGRIVLEGGSTQPLSGKVFYNACYNSPAGAQLSFSVIDSSGKLVGKRFAGNIASVGTRDGDRHEHYTAKGEFDESFVVPTATGTYALLYTVNATFKGKLSALRQGIVYFSVDGGDEPDSSCADDGTCDQIEQVCAPSDPDCSASADDTPADGDITDDGVVVDSGTGLAKSSSGAVLKPSLNLFICRSTVEDSDKCLENAVQVSKGGSAKIRYEVTNMTCRGTNLPDVSVSTTSFMTENEIDSSKAYTLNCNSLPGAGDATTTSKTVRAAVVDTKEF